MGYYKSVKVYIRCSLCVDKYEQDNYMNFGHCFMTVLESTVIYNLHRYNLLEVFHDMYEMEITIFFLRPWRRSLRS